MKIRFSKLMTLVAVLFGGMLASCAPEEITRVPAKMSLENADEMGVATLTLSSRAETKSMSFEADGDWYIRIPKDCDWLTVSPASGTGNATVNFTSAAYDQLVPRTAKVAFVVDGVEQKAILEVTQLQQYVVTPTVLSSVVPKTGGEYTVDVATNGTFTVALDNEGKQWLEVVSVESNAVVFNAKPIDATVAKNRAKITFTCVEDEGVVAELNISQKNLEISLDAKTIRTAAHRGSGEIDVTLLNVNEWKIEADSWIKTEKKNGKIAFSFDRNPLSVTREGTISAICADSDEDADVKGVVKVYQQPGADLVDLVFNQDGTVNDASPRSLPTRQFSQAVASMNYYEEYASWGPTVNRTAGSTMLLAENPVWFCEYTSFMSNIEDNYTIEAIFSIAAAHNNKESKAFGATASGGFALMLGGTGDKTNSDGTKVTRNGSIEFIQHDGKGWNFGVTNVIPEPGKLYHVFGVWDGENLKCYIDGELKFSGKVTKFKHATRTPRTLGVAGNYYGEEKTDGTWNGTVVSARMYDNPLSAEDIAAKTAFAKASHPGCVIEK